MADEEVPVLIVGGSLVGLSTAVFLGARGVPSLVVERHVGTAIHPRAALVNQRTMENYRTIGLEEEIAEAAAREFVQNGAIVSVESLGGKGSWRKDHIADQTFVQGFTTHNNKYDFVTLGSFETMYAADLQKPPGANFWDWIKTAQFKV
jgi:2-polyprenyl-6-methoxyphenol hydroxylase-like FAD-dependent oxidoreductase